MKKKVVIFPLFLHWFWRNLNHISFIQTHILSLYSHYFWDWLVMPWRSHYSGAKANQSLNIVYVKFCFRTTLWTVLCRDSLVTAWHNLFFCECSHVTMSNVTTLQCSSLTAVVLQKLLSFCSCVSMFFLSAILQVYQNFFSSLKGCYQFMDHHANCSSFFAG